MSSSSPQDEVVTITANLAERQAAATQLPRLSSAALTPSKKSRRSAGALDSPSPTTKGAIRQNDGGADEYGREPRVDEAAIARMTAEGRNSTDESVANKASRPRTSRKSTSGSGSALLRKKRMTVLMDEEMPSGDEDSGEEEEEEEEEDEEGESEGVESGEGEEETDTSASGRTAADDAGQQELEIEEQDADIGEYGEEENGDKGVPSRATVEDDTRMMDSIATLKAVERALDPGPELHADDEVAVGEGTGGEGGIDDEEEEPTLKYARLKGSVPDVLKKDSASALAVSDRFLALGTHSGAIYILDEQGNLIKGFRSHTASVLDLVIDSTAEFVGSAGMDGLVSVSGLSSSESYTFDFKRVMRAISLEPSFGRRSTRSFVCGGMAGQLVLREKSWFGHRETILHEGEGPVWTTKWNGQLIAWATDRGVRIYDTQSRQRISLISPPLDSPRADLFRCSLFWQDEATLLIAWADHIKVAKVRQRNKKQGATPAAASASPMQLYVEVTAILQLDCMISGIAPRGKDYLILAYITEDAYSDDSSIVEDREAQKRKDGLRPELRLISSDGEELSSDVLSLESFARFQCNDYLLVPSADIVAAPTVNGNSEDSSADYFYVVSPRDIVVARSRDEKDHIDWLLQHRRYYDALQSLEAMGGERSKALGFNAEAIGRKYLTYLIHEQADYAKAASVAPSILGADAPAWENIIFTFIEKQQLGHIIPVVPISEPTLSGVIYDMILAHFLRFDLQLLYGTIRRWPAELYSTRAVVLAIEDRLNGESSKVRLLMECLAEVFIKNRQPGKALPYFLRLRKPGVFDLIREHNLFTVVQDQALLLVEFEEDIKQENQLSKHGPAIDLLVDHTHSIPIHRVVPQLQAKPKYLYKYLDALFDRDPQQVASYSDVQVNLYAEYEYAKLMAYLRTMSSYYSFEKAYNTCKQFDYVPEMVFLLSRIGDNKTALMLIIERLQDVERAIEFVKEEKDADLWEDLLHYSENRPRFIKGLLENVGSEVDAVKLIKRIRNGLEIEGLKTALIKILHDFNLQISLLEGCEAIFSHDGRNYSQLLHEGQSQGLYCDKESLCSSCGERLFDARVAPGLAVNSILFLCRHAHHLSCLVSNVDSVPKYAQSTTPSASSSGVLTMNTTQALASGAHYACGPYGPKLRTKQSQAEYLDQLRYQNRLRVVLKKGCPVCLNESSMPYESRSQERR